MAPPGYEASTTVFAEASAKSAVSAPGRKDIPPNLPRTLTGWNEPVPLARSCIDADPFVAEMAVRTDPESATAAKKFPAGRLTEVEVGLDNNPWTRSAVVRPGT